MGPTGSDIKHWLMTSELLAGADEHAADVLVSRVKAVFLAAGQTLFCEGDTADAAYVVAAGLLEVCRGDRSAPSHVAWAGPGRWWARPRCWSRRPEAPWCGPRRTACSSCWTATR